MIYVTMAHVEELSELCMKMHTSRTHELKVTDSYELVTH